MREYVPNCSSHVVVVPSSVLRVREMQNNSLFPSSQRKLRCFSITRVTAAAAGAAAGAAAAARIELSFRRLCLSIGLTLISDKVRI